MPINVAVYSALRTATGSTAAAMVPNRSADATFPKPDEVRPARLSPYKVNPAESKKKVLARKPNLLATLQTVAISLLKQDVEMGIHEISMPLFAIHILIN